jgi:hypothetical protein
MIHRCFNNVELVEPSPHLSVLISFVLIFYLPHVDYGPIGLIIPIIFPQLFSIIYSERIWRRHQ